MNSNDNKIGKSYIEMLNSEQYKIAMRYRHLSILWSICESNRIELLNVIDFSAKEQNALHLMDQKNKQAFQAYMNEFVRTFLNHIGSIYIFIEYSRRENRYLDSINKHITGYAQKVEELFSANELVQFVNNLRNYCIHVSVPNFTFSFSFSTIEESKQFLYITKEDLLKDDSWNKKALKYLSGCDDKVIILNIVNDYYSVQKTFYKWFNDEYYAKCEKEIDYVKEAHSSVNI